MPKVVISNANGLVERPGGGLKVNTTSDLNGSVTVSAELRCSGSVFANGQTLSGHHKKIKTITSSRTLTKEDSGKLFLVGGNAGTIQFPIDTAGWHGSFFITGSVAADVILSASAATAGSVVNMFATVISGSGGVGSAGILFTSPKDIRFDQSGQSSRQFTNGAYAGSRINIDVLKANSIVIATGMMDD